MPKNLIITAAALLILGIIVYARPAGKAMPVKTETEPCTNGQATCLPKENFRSEEWIPENPNRQLIFISNFN